MSEWVTIVGKPVPFARPGQGANGRRFTPRAYRDWKHLAVEYMRMVHNVKPLEVDVAAYVEVHADKVRGRIEADGTPVLIRVTNRGRPKGVRGDLDNYVKAFLDAAQDAQWIGDDRQVVAILAQFMREED